MGSQLVTTSVVVLYKGEGQGPGCCVCPYVRGVKERRLITEETNSKNDSPDQEDITNIDMCWRKCYRKVQDFSTCNVVTPRRTHEPTAPMLWRIVRIEDLGLHIGAVTDMI